jgi:hypothetical protein
MHGQHNIKVNLHDVTNFWKNRLFGADEIMRRAENDKRSSRKIKSSNQNLFFFVSPSGRLHKKVWN